MQQQVIEARTFGVVKCGNLVVLAFRSPEALKDMARTLTSLSNRDERYTRVLESTYGAKGTCTKEDIEMAILASDIIPGRSTSVPTLVLGGFKEK